MLNTVYAIDKRQISWKFLKKIKNNNISLTRLLSIYCIQNCTNSIIHESQFYTNMYGKPILKNMPELFFNISHSKDLIICIVSNKNIGIDIEYIKPVTLLPKVKIFFTKNEWEYIYNSENKINSFFELWTLKESYVKYRGYGIIKGFSKIEIFKNETCYHVLENAVKCNNLEVYSLEIEHKYRISICSETKVKSVYPKLVEPEKLNKSLSYFLENRNGKNY